MIKLTLRIKFRAFFVDLLKIERVFEVPYNLPAGTPRPKLDNILINERGVYLKIDA